MYWRKSRSNSATGRALELGRAPRRSACPASARSVIDVLPVRVGDGLVSFGQPLLHLGDLVLLADVDALGQQAEVVAGRPRPRPAPSSPVPARGGRASRGRRRRRRPCRRAASRSSISSLGEHPVRLSGTSELDDRRRALARAGVTVRRATGRRGAHEDEAATMVLARRAGLRWGRRRTAETGGERVTHDPVQHSYRRGSGRRRVSCGGGRDRRPRRRPDGRVGPAGRSPHRSAGGLLPVHRRREQHRVARQQSTGGAVRRGSEQLRLRQLRSGLHR